MTQVFTTSLFCSSQIIHTVPSGSTHTHTHRRGKGNDVFSCISCCVRTQLLQSNSFKIKAFSVWQCVLRWETARTWLFQMLCCSSAAGLTEEERAHTYTEEDHLYKQDSASGTTQHFQFWCRSCGVTVEQILVPAAVERSEVTTLKPVHV